MTHPPDCARTPPPMILLLLLSSCARPSGPSAQQSPPTNRASTIAFVSTRDAPDPAPALAAEIYLMNADGSNQRRITTNTYADFFPKLSPDGTRILFDSNRRRLAGEPLNVFDLFVMNPDGSDQMYLAPGTSGSWSPDGARIAFHASASGKGVPLRTNPGAAASDNDLFVLTLPARTGGTVTSRNITNTPDLLEEDVDWSPDGRRLVFTSHGVNDPHQNAITAELYVIAADGTGDRVRLTANQVEERAPAWSPDGSRIVFMCRTGSDFDLCIMNADGSNVVHVTDNEVPDLTPSWSPDGRQIVFHRPVDRRPQLWVINADGSGERQLTSSPGISGWASWGELTSR